jgi:hypothetical protein
MSKIKQCFQITPEGEGGVEEAHVEQQEVGSLLNYTVQGMIAGSRMRMAA